MSDPSPTRSVNAADDQRWMRVAIAEARRAEGRSGANPPVGCAIISPENHLLGVGCTAPGGRPHAETEALSFLAGTTAAGATAYVTLEPCAHHGQTPPCAEALVAAGVARVVIAVQDPDPRVNGGGIAILQEAGIVVDTGVCADEARRVMAGFLTRVTQQRPFISWKTATSLDGMIALADGKKRWLTGPDMRRFVHELRGRADGVLSAIGTVLADDPAFTCRNPGLEADSPHCFVLDGSLRTPVDAALVSTTHERGVTLFCREDALAERKKALTACGVEICGLPVDGAGRLDINAALRVIADAGCNHLLVEAGAGLGKTLFKADLVDRIIWTQSQHILGGDAIPAIGGLSMLALPVKTHYIQCDKGVLGDDSWCVLERRHS